MYRQGHCVFIAIIKPAFPPHFPNGCRGPVFLPKDTLDCDKMKWSSSAVDVVMSLRGRHMWRPPAAPPNIYHLSHTERWHLFILPAQRSRNQFPSNTIPHCNMLLPVTQFSYILALFECHMGAHEGFAVGCVSWMSLFRCIDGVGEWLRCHRHVDTTVWKWSEAVSPLLAWRGIRCLPHIWGMSGRRKLVFFQLSLDLICWNLNKLLSTLICCLI